MTSRTSGVLALVADSVTNLMLCFLLLLAMMWASVVCGDRGQAARWRDGRQHLPEAWTPMRSAAEDQLKQRGASSHTKNATREAGKAAQRSAHSDLLSFTSNSTDAFQGFTKISRISGKSC